VKANKIILGVSALLVIAWLVAYLTPVYLHDEWRCSEDVRAAVAATLRTNCSTDYWDTDYDNCNSFLTWVLYHVHACEGGKCVYSDVKACTAPINSPVLRRVAAGVGLHVWPVYVGFVAFLFHQRLNWKGGRLVAIGAVVTMLLQQIRLQLIFNQYSFGMLEPWCSEEWAGLECHDEDYDTINEVVDKTMGVVLLLLFGRIALWDSFVSYQKQQPIRSSAGYVMALSVLTICFPVSERQRVFSVTLSRIFSYTSLIRRHLRTHSPVCVRCVDGDFD
jgi:hypothetical protein